MTKYPGNAKVVALRNVQWLLINTHTVSPDGRGATHAIIIGFIVIVIIIVINSTFLFSFADCRQPPAAWLFSNQFHAVFNIYKYIVYSTCSMTREIYVRLYGMGGFPFQFLEMMSCCFSALTLAALGINVHSGRLFSA